MAISKNQVEQLLRRWDKLQGDRANWETLWDEVIKYVMPDRMPVYGGTAGEKRTKEIYSSAPIRALDRLAAVLNSMLTNSSIDWFELGTGDAEQDKETTTKEWLDKTAKVIKDALDGSNFGMEISELYQDIGGLGTACLLTEEGDGGEDDDMYFSCRPMREVYLTENAKGEVDGVFAKREMTPRQIVQKWGKRAAGPEIAGLLDDKPDEAREVVHIVVPREDAPDKPANSKQYPFASYWLDVQTKRVLFEGGYREFPYCVPRWRKSPGETYGRSPVISNLSDIITLNEQEKTLLKVGQKIADPPLNVPEDMESPNLRPGALNYYTPGRGEGIVPIEIGKNLPITFEMIQAKQDAINDGLYVTRLQLIDTRQMTAEEVRQRSLENMRMLGPTFGRMVSELFQGLIERCFAILNRAGKIPVPPASIQGKNLKIRYISPIAKSQRQHVADAVIRTVNVASAIAKVKPDIVDVLDWDEAVQQIADQDGVPQSVIRDDDAIAKIRQARQQAQQAQAQAQLAQQQGQAAKNFAEAGKAAVEAEGMQQ